VRFQCYRTTEASYYWRLLSGNHRIVAMAPDGFDGPKDAVDAARHVRDHAADALIDLTSDRGVAWRWAMRVDGRTVAVCAHPYGRRVEAQSAAGRFRDGAAEATIDDRVLLLGSDKVAASCAVGPEHGSRRG
jgi:uncharacterized protein YegP (UPF0339 family)